MRSLRKFFSDIGLSTAWIVCAQASKAGSWVTPRSKVTASNLVIPGLLRCWAGSPPSRCATGSVVRFSALIFDSPATYRPSHRTRKLNALYGSKRVGLMVNSAISRLQFRDLADGDDNELR